MNNENQLDSILSPVNDLINIIPCGMGLFDIENGQPIFLNDEFYRIINYSRAEHRKILPFQEEMLIHPQDTHLYEKCQMDFLQTFTDQYCQIRVFRKDGQLFWGNIKVSAVTIGEKVYAFVSFTDITESKTSELRSLLKHHRYQFVVDELKASIFEWNHKIDSFYSSTAYDNYVMSEINNSDILNNRGTQDITHPDDVEEMQRFYAETTSGKDRIESILRLKMRDGSYRWSKLIGFFLKDEQGAPDRTIGVIIDINDEREKSFMLDSLINEIPGGVAIFKVDKKLNCSYYSDGFAQISGRTREEIDNLMQNNKFLESLIAPSDYPRFISEVTECTAKGLPINITFRYLLKDLSANWLHLSARKMRDEDGCPIYYCVFTKPSDETSLYRNIVENSALGVLVAERDSRRILYCNDKMNEFHNGALKNNKDNLHIDFVSKENQLLTTEQILSLDENDYSEFHIVRDNGMHLGIRAKALEWNGVDSYILYVSDETAEHEHQIQLQELIDRVPSGVGIFEVYDNDAHLVYMNDGFYRMISDTREHYLSVIENNFTNAMHPDDAHLIRKAVEKITGGASEADFIYRSLTGDGGYMWIRNTISVIDRKESKITVYCSLVDYSEAMSAREKLEKSNITIMQQYEQELARRKLLEKGSLVSICSNITMKKIVEIKSSDNKSLEYSANMDFDEAVENLLKTVPNEKDRAMLANLMQCENIINWFKEGISEGTIEYRSYQNDGRLHWIKAVCSVTEDITTGNIFSYVYFYDIDDEKKARLASESVVDEEIDYVMLYNVKDDKMKFVHLKKAMDTPIFRSNFTLNEVFDSEEYRAVVPEDKALVSEFFNRDTLLEKLTKDEIATVTYRKKSDEGIILRKKSRAFYLDDTHDDIVIARRDITDLYREEQRQKEVLRQAADKAILASKAKSEFLSRMSHDMRTPMNGILGLAELSNDEYSSDVLRNNIFRIKESGNYLLSLINDTLDFQRIESGKLTLETQIVSMNTVLNSIVDIIRPTAKSKNIDFRMEIKNIEVDRYVRVDPVRIKQIFINLLSNAVKFTSDGGTITFEIQCLSREDNVSHTLMKISDTGIGMSEDFIKSSLYQPFMQEHSIISTQYAGSGLGLSIVHSLVEIMGGKIQVESELGEGTTFTVYLDLELVNPSEAEKALQQDKRQKSNYVESLVGKKILLVEDHPLNAEISKKLLQKMGCEVTWANNGKNGVETFAQSPENYFDAVLMDIRMPVMNGLDAAAELRTLNRSDAKTMPIIAMTANAYEADVEKSLVAGMNAHLAKPIEPQKMYETLASFIGT